MTQIRRARVALLGATVMAGAILIAELPIGELLHQRSDLASAQLQLKKVEANNSALRSDITALHKPSTIAAIAHAEYGLVKPGQRSYVILPAAGGKTTNALANETLPASSVVASDGTGALNSPASGPTIGAGGTKMSGSVWNRVVDRLAFWRWAF